MSSALETPPKVVVKLADLVQQTGLCARTIQRMIHRGDFPPPTVRSKKVALWSPQVIEAWAKGEWRPEKRPARRRQTASATR